MNHISIYSIFLLGCILHFSCNGQSNPNTLIDSIGKNSNTTVFNNKKIKSKSIEDFSSESMISLTDIQFLFKEGKSVYRYRGGEKKEIYNLKKGDFVHFSKNKKFAFIHTPNSQEWQSTTEYTITQLSANDSIVHFNTPSFLYGSESIGEFIPLNTGKSAIQILNDPLANGIQLKIYDIIDKGLEEVHFFNFPELINPYFDYDEINQFIYFSYSDKTGTHIKSYTFEGLVNWEFFLEGFNQSATTIAVNTKTPMLALVVSHISGRNKHELKLIKNGSLYRSFSSFNPCFFTEGNSNLLISHSKNKFQIYDIEKETLLEDSLSLRKNEVILNAVMGKEEIAFEIYSVEETVLNNQNHLKTPQIKIMKQDLATREIQEVETTDLINPSLFWQNGLFIYRDKNRLKFFKNEK